MRVRITKTPAGEAPHDVRNAWIGLVLPLVPGDAGPHEIWTQGVLTGPRTFWAYLWARLLRRFRIVHGFRVDAARAIQVLAEHDVQAASWWRTHVPTAVQPGRVFVFEADACELIDGPPDVPVVAPEDKDNPGGPYTSDVH